jgi:hypothetical protein
VWLVVGNARFAQHCARLTTRALSALLVTGTFVQSLLGREFWHGGNANALTAMTSFMIKTPQPHWLTWLARPGGLVADTMGSGFNLVVVLWRLVGAEGLWRSTCRPLQWPVWTLISGCLLMWLVAEDGAIDGGLATDPNSLVPLAVLAWCAVLSGPATVLREKRLPNEMRSSTGAVAFAAAAVAFFLASMGWASLASSQNTYFLDEIGPASQVAGPAASFTLVDQSGSSYHPGEHPGHYSLLTFLDPVCWSDCPLLARQLQSVLRTLVPRAA